MAARHIHKTDVSSILSQALSDGSIARVARDVIRWPSVLEMAVRHSDSVSETCVTVTAAALRTQYGVTIRRPVVTSIMNEAGRMILQW